MGNVKKLKYLRKLSKQKGKRNVFIQNVDAPDTANYKYAKKYWSKRKAL